MTGVILAAGYGTRFLPASKSVPKELFPIIHRPALDFITQEFLEAGITRLFVITNRRKRAVEDYFDNDVELQRQLAGTPMAEALPDFFPIPVAFIRQESMKGTGHALLSLKPFMGNEPFIVAYPDDIIWGSNISTQLIEAHRKFAGSVLACVEVPYEHSNRYGMVGLGDQVATGIHKLNGFVEKPPPEKAPSRWASIGRFLYTPDFLTELESTYRDFTGKGEFYHVDAVLKLAARSQILALKADGQRFDIGERAGFWEFSKVVAAQMGLS